MAQVKIKANEGLTCGVYVTNGIRLYEVVALTSHEASLLNVVTDLVIPWPRSEVETWEVILPRCPDTADSLL